MADLTPTSPSNDGAMSALAMSKTPPPRYEKLPFSAMSYPSNVARDETSEASGSGESVISDQTQQSLSPLSDGGLPEVVMTPDSDPQEAISLRSSLQPLPSDLTVTPLHLLEDQSDMVDCPFCRRCVETRVLKEPSAATHASAAGLFMVSIGGVYVPYKKQWKHHVSHFCTNCERKVAYKRNGWKEMKALGTPDHLRQVSRFPLAQRQSQVVQSP